ncbi:hypothetical protein JCM8547_006833 [Rhodosporidiobolus lusitaniae]
MAQDSAPHLHPGHAPLRGSPPGSPRAPSLQASAEHSPEPDGRSADGGGGGREGEDDRDELEDEGDEDAASTSTDRARSSEPSSSAAVPAYEGTPTLGDQAMARMLPQAPGTKTQAAFVHKLYSMLETPSLQHLISWSDDGKSFIIYHPSEFARIVLPQYFKHSNFSSFIRQGNFYHFSKISDVPGTPAKTAHTNADGSPVQTWEFRNPNFQRGRPDLLARIKRKTAKSTAATANSSSNAAVKRRASVTALTSLRPTRRDSIASGDGEYEQERERERDLSGETAVIGGLAGAAIAAGGMVRPAGGAGDHPPPPKRIAAGLADFGPDDSSRRVKEEERNEGGGHSPPPSFHRRAGQPAPTAAPLGFPPSDPSYSPGTRAHPLHPTSSFASSRYAQPDDPVARQLFTLESQVQSLSEGLYRAQHEFAAYRSTSASVLQTLLGIVASLDPEGRRKEEIEACAFALSKLGPETSPQQFNHPAFSSFPPAYGSAPPWAYPFGGPPGTAGGVLQSPRPSTSNSHQFYYNRVPAVESYTRGSRPEPPSHHHSHQHTSGSSSESRPPSSAVPPPYHYPPSHHHPPQHNGHAPHPPSHENGTKPPPPPHPAPSAAAAASHSSRPPSSGPHAVPSSFSHSYPSPRLSWAGGGASRPDSATGERERKPTTTLPPLSSLLNPVGGGLPPFNGGERRGLPDGMGESEEERARKKVRQ